MHVLSPARTLVEKLVIVHEAHQRPHGPGREQRIVKIVRHYYDIWCLLGGPTVRTELAGHGTAVLAREVCQHSKAIGLPSVNYPTGGFAPCAAFDPKSTASQHKAYVANVPQLLWPSATFPTFGQCLERLADHGHIL